MRRKEEGGGRRAAWGSLHAAAGAGFVMAFINNISPWRVCVCVLSIVTITDTIGTAFAQSATSLCDQAGVIKRTGALAATRTRSELTLQFVLCQNEYCAKGFSECCTKSPRYFFEPPGGDGATYPCCELCANEFGLYYDASVSCYGEDEDFKNRVEETRTKWGYCTDPKFLTWKCGPTANMGEDPELVEQGKVFELFCAPEDKESAGVRNASPLWIGLLIAAFTTVCLSPIRWLSI